MEWFLGVADAADFLRNVSAAVTQERDVQAEQNYFQYFQSWNLLFSA